MYDTIAQGLGGQKWKYSGPPISGDGTPSGYLKLQIVSNPIYVFPMVHTYS